MTYIVTLDVFQGAEAQSRSRTTYSVEESAPLSAMAKAEQHLNVLLPENQYAIACFARRVDPRPPMGMVMVLAEAA